MCKYHEATVEPSAIGATMGIKDPVVAACDFAQFRRIIEQAGRVPSAFMLRGATHAVG